LTVQYPYEGIFKKRLKNFKLSADESAGESNRYENIHPVIDKTKKNQRVIETEEKSPGD